VRVVDADADARADADTHADGERERDALAERDGERVTPEALPVAENVADSDAVLAEGVISCAYEPREPRRGELPGA
jgi:hypothetical protein